jgi:hypothetical protein
VQKGYRKGGLMKEKELNELTNEELIEVYKYYKPKAKRLGKEEYKYLIAIEREINKRHL